MPMVHGRGSFHTQEPGRNLVKQEKMTCSHTAIWVLGQESNGILWLATPKLCSPDLWIPEETQNMCPGVKSIKHYEVTGASTEDLCASLSEEPNIVVCGHSGLVLWTWELGDPVGLISNIP